MMTVLFFVFILSYIVGGIPFGFIIGKLNGIDIRSSGSGNIGATNIVRVCGKRWGYLCFILDAVKGLVPVLVSKQLTQPNDYLPIVAVFGVVCGHIWSPYLNFRGGKGVATSAGALLGIAPVAVISCLVLWYLVFATSRYVSLASIVAAASLPVIVVVVDQIRSNSSQRLGVPVTIMFIILALIVVLRHRTNIQRLLNGTENKFIKEAASE